ncbi:MAG TPA: AsmA family protein [Burkholderiales bacterium]|nr:AsmA family protein [Burkholderiales bacterium]
MKAIKITLYVFAGLLVLLVLGVAIFAMTFDPNRYKGQIESIVKDKTGRTLQLAGDLQVAFWPSLGAKVNGVTLSERAADEKFLSLDSAHASVAVLPLLHGSVVVDGIRVSGLKANIVKNKDGTFNFSDLLEQKEPASKSAEKKAEQREEQGGQAVAFDIASIHIDRSAVSYRDLASGQELAISDFALDTGRIAQQADGKLSLQASARGKNPDLDVKLDVGGQYKFDLPAKAFSLSGLDAKVNGAAAGITNLAVSAKGDVAANPDKSEYHVKGLALDAQGAMPDQSFAAHVSAPQVDIAANSARGGAISVQATLKQAAREIQAALQLSGVEGSAKALSVPKLTADIAMTGEGVPQKSVKVPVTGSLRADLEKQTANADLTAKFDESTIQAKLGLAKFSPPSYLFDVNVDRLNVDRYFPPEKEASAGSQPGKPGEAGKEAADTPVDLSALKDLRADGRLQVGALQARGLKLANLKAQVKAANGRLDVAPHSANLYEGSVAGAISAQADGRVAVKETLSGISIGPLLRDAANKDILEGHGNVALDVAAAGKSVNAMKKALDGTARLQLKDGAIKGVNIAEILRKAKTALSSQEAKAQAAQAQQTDFSEMSASFVIKSGIARNNDLEMKAPLFRVGGQGEVNIPASTLDYTVKASVVATTQGQGGADLSQLAGVTVPVHLTGPLADMKYDVDYGAVARDVAKSKIGEKLKERLGGQSGQGSSDLEKKLDKLKGLFGR